MRRNLAFCLIWGCLSVAFCYGSLTWIDAEVVDLGGGRWQYNYNLTNLGLLIEGQPAAIEEFTIWFDFALYGNLAVTTADPPASAWDEIVLQPDPVLQDAGAYDALAESTNPGIGTGQTEGLFSVAFDWLGSGIPGSQYYEIILPGTVPLEVIDSGWTIPEPMSLALLVLGGFLIRKR